MAIYDPEMKPKKNANIMVETSFVHQSQGRKIKLVTKTEIFNSSSRPT